MATTRTVTDEDLLHLQNDGNKYELVDGELRPSPAGWAHEAVVVNLIALLAPYVRMRKLGRVLGSNTLYVLPSGNKRRPDVSFVSSGRLPSKETASAPFLNLVPDLAVEVVSPRDTPRSVLDRVGQYLQAGVRLIWVIDPERRQAVVHRSLSQVREITENGELDGEDVIPGFRCQLAELFDIGA